MQRAKQFVAVVAVLFATVLIHNWCVYTLADPAGAALAKAEELGWPEGDIVLAAGSYSSEFLGWRSSVEFRSKSRPAAGEIRVEVRRSTLFHPWVLSEYEQGKG